MKSIFSLLILLLTFFVPVQSETFTEVVQESQPSPMRVWFDTWHRNRMRYNEYNDSIFIRCERQNWVDLCIRRAESYREMFRENQNCLDAMHAYFNRPVEEIPSADYDTLFSLCENNGKGIDVFMANDLMNILEKHFAAHHDTPQELLYYLSALYYQTSFLYQFNYFGGEDHLKSSYTYLRQLLSFSGHPTVLEVKDLQERMLMGWGLFALLSNNYVSAGIITSAEADSIVGDIRLRLELQEWNWIGEFISGRLEQAYAPIAGCMITEAERKLLGRYYGFIQSYKGTKTEKIDVEVIYKDEPLKLARARWKEHRITADEAMKVLDSLNVELGDSIPPLDELVSGGLNDALQQIQFLSEIIDSTSLSTDERREKAREAYKFFYSVMLACQGRNDIRNTAALEQTVHDNALLPYLSREEHMNLLNKVMLTLQVNTYAHSTHLRKLVMALLQGVISHRPDLLVGMPGCGSVAEVKDQRDSLLNFIGQAALFHDLGKNSMGAIVTNDFRKLYDVEFNILKTHPDRGIRYLSIDSTFQIFRDITLGHHRWYDGSKGYPMSFDIVNSPIRVMIDIVSICDCLEAATDAVGRNYNPLKIFQTLMDEFDADAGTRYNPDIVQVIHDDPALWKELEQQVTPQGCYTNYYDVYSQFFTE